MTQIPIEIIDFIQEFLQQPEFHESGLETVVLLGSYATGRATERSDIDFDRKSNEVIIS